MKKWSYYQLHGMQVTEFKRMVERTAFKLKIFRSRRYSGGITPEEFLSILCRNENVSFKEGLNFVANREYFHDLIEKNGFTKKYVDETTNSILFF